MTNTERILRTIKHPRTIGSALLRIFAHWITDDEWYVKKRYYLSTGDRLNLESPQTFNDKLNWLKLYDRQDEYTIMADKIEAKKYVAGIIGEKHIIPTLGIWYNPYDIDFDSLPEQFVLKCNHCSSVYICKENKYIREKEIKKSLIRDLQQDYYIKDREWPYKNIKRRILAEKYMVDESGYELKDYKFFCFNGKVKFFKIDFDRQVGHHANYFDPQGNLLPFGEVEYMPIPERKLAIPSNLAEMICIAEKLAENIPFIRVDLYNVKGQIYFGELTFFPASGRGALTPKEWEYTLGSLIKLPTTKEYKK